MIAPLQKPHATGKAYNTPAEHLNNMRKSRPLAMICILELPGDDVSCAIQGTPEQLQKMFLALASVPSVAPYIMATAEIIAESFGEDGLTPQ